MAASLAMPLLLAVLFAPLAAAATWLALRLRILDVPNQRSSHSRPVPKSGGIAIVAAFLGGLGVAALAAESPLLPGGRLPVFVLAAAGVAVLGLLDDLGRVRSVAVKLGVQLAAALALVAGGVSLRTLAVPGIGEVALGVWGAPLTVLWVVALTNMVNFMDGLDGLAGGTAAVAAVFVAVAAALAGATFTLLAAALLAAGSLGFLVFNHPPARIFMGDVGSQFLGFAFAALAVIAAGHDRGAVPFLAMPLIWFGFVFDTALTVARRLFAGEDVTKAHRAHLYQLLARLGAGHGRVAALHAAMAALGGIGALWMLDAPAEARALAFLPLLALQGVYAAVVLRRAARRGLLARG